MDDSFKFKKIINIYMVVTFFYLEIIKLFVSSIDQIDKTFKIFKKNYTT